MQAITIAIGKNGVVFFTQQLVAKELIKTLSAMKAPDREITIDHINIEFSHANNIDIKLLQGTLVNFAPVFQSVSQQADGNFTLLLGAGNFSALYKWNEKYQYTFCTFDPDSGRSCLPTENKDDTFDYKPAFGSLNVTVPLKFQYDATRKEWDVVAGTSSATPPSAQANIPSDSIVQHEDPGCFTSHVTDATSTAVASIDFSTAISQLIQGVVASIPASGDLGNKIKYDFSLGDDGLKFPGNDGIQMGVRGGASYDGTDFPGAAPPKVPLPPALADADAHHLNMYVSNYEIDALHWAYYKAGKLSIVVNPTDLTDPSVLKVATYVNLEPSLKPFQAFTMQAQISATEAPASTFELVWEFTKDVETPLRQHLPPNVYDLLSGLLGNAYVSQTTLEADLKDATIDAQYYKTIEDITQRMGMVVSNVLTFDLVIQNGQTPKPDVKFSVKRTDILTNLRLGVGANNTQTLQYDFLHVGFDAKFISSTVPGFKGDNFGNVVYPIGGEPRYAEVMAEMGKTGAPLPIMADFKFDFREAQLSVQQGYVSILANVEYKGTLR